MGPIVTEVENIDELLTRLESSKLDEAAVLNWLVIQALGIWHSDTTAIGKLELMEM